MSTLPRITAHRAATHEALHARLAALQKQADTIAGRRPELAVPGPVRATAVALLEEARALLGRQGARQVGTLGPAPGYAVLAIAVGQARMLLEGFDQRHS